MTETLVYAGGPPFIPPRDDLTIPQFLLDEPNAHFTKRPRSSEVPCFIEEESGRSVYIEELRNRSHALARALKEKFDISLGDVVSIFCPNHVDYGVIAWAVHRLGGVIATHSPMLTTEEFAHQLEIVKPVLVVAYPTNLDVALKGLGTLHLPLDRLVLLDGTNPQYASIAGLIDSGETCPDHEERRFKPGEARKALAFLCFSSGTTGKPKAVCVSHYNVISNMAQLATYNRNHEEFASYEERTTRAGDICIGVLPVYHIYGLVINLHYMLYGALTVIISKTFNFDDMLKTIERYHVTHLTIVVPHAMMLCRHPATKKYDLSSVRFCSVGATAMSLELTEQLAKIIPNAQLRFGWGMTEICAAGSLFPVTQKLDNTLGSCGQLISGTAAKVVRSDGTLALLGERGELYIKGPQVTMGYYHNDEATNEAFVDGWLHTGDEAFIRQNGDVFVTGRIKDLIKVKTYQVSPFELEEYLMEHPDVLEAAVIGIPDENAGELPRAYVVLRPSTAAAVASDAKLAQTTRLELYKKVSQITSRYKWLDGGIEFTEVIPKNQTGKILRRVLREQAKTIPIKQTGRLSEEDDRLYGHW